MTLDQLRYFLSAAKYQHVTRAAQASNISSSVISHAIKSLEEELGVSLFQRVGRQIVITEHGQELRRRAHLIIDDVTQLPTQIRKEKPELNGHYRIAASHFLSSRYLNAAVVAVQAKHPKARFDLSASYTSTIISDVTSGRLEAGLCFLPIKHPDLEEFAIYQGGHAIVVRRNHPICKGSKRVRITDLVHYPALFHRLSASHDLTPYSAAMKKLGIMCDPISTYDNADIGIPMVLKTDCWTIAPDICVKAFERQLEVIPAPSQWNLPLRVSMICRRENASDRAMQELREALKAVFPSRPIRLSSNL